jgi:hypothetical protein
VTAGEAARARQLATVGGNAPAHQRALGLGGCPASGLILEMAVGERLTVLIAQNARFLRQSKAGERGAAGARFR